MKIRHFKLAHLIRRTWTILLKVVQPRFVRKSGQNRTAPWRQRSKTCVEVAFMREMRFRNWQYKLAKQVPAALVLAGFACVLDEKRINHIIKCQVATNIIDRSVLSRTIFVIGIAEFVFSLVEKFFDELYLNYLIIILTQGLRGTFFWAFITPSLQVLKCCRIENRSEDHNKAGRHIHESSSRSHWVGLKYSLKCGTRAGGNVPDLHIAVVNVKSNRRTFVIRILTAGFPSHWLSLSRWKLIGKL